VIAPHSEQEVCWLQAILSLPKAHPKPLLVLRRDHRLLYTKRWHLGQNRLYGPKLFESKIL
jgi:hypothetical protein